jgi:hypothetical protein
MTTRQRILIALVLFVVPILVRFFLFYQLPYFNSKVQRPDYASFTIPQPPTPSSKLAPVTKVEDGKVVIVDANHGNQFEPSEIEPLVTALSARGGRVEFDKGAQPLAAQLKYASTYAVFSPSIGFSGDEIRAIRKFVESGGRLLVFSDPTRSLTTYDSLTGNQITLPDVNYANPLLAPFGLTFVNDYLYNLEDNEGNFRNVKFTDFADNPLTGGLNMVVFYGAHSIQTNTGTPLAFGDAKTLSSLTDKGGSLSPAVLSANGQVLALGDFSFLTNPFNQVADNGMLLGAIADFALGGNRTPSLVNFPYVFQRPVSLITTGDIQITSDLLSPLASLQSTLNAVNISVNVRSAAPKEGDLIVLGTLTPSDDLTPYLKPFGITLEEDAKTIDVKGLGTVSTKGSGLLLFNRGTASNTLVLLAPSTDALPDLIKVVASGDLSSCVIQDNIGVCAAGGASSGSGFGDYFDFGTPTPVEELPTDLTPTPTPVG